MKKELGLAVLAILFCALNAIPGAHALEEQENTLVISKEEIDVTGDGKEDVVEIKAHPYEKGASFLKEIFLEIQASDGNTYRKELKGGFEPTIHFVDLNHDRLADMFISIPIGGSGGISNYFLYTLKDFQLTDITVPDALVITSQFQDGYKALVTIENTGETYTFDLKDRKKDYERLGLYQKGKLNEPTELMVDPYSTLKPLKLKNNHYGFKAVQQISGAYHADRIALIESTWYYDNGKWNLMGTKITEAEHKRKK